MVAEVGGLVVGFVARTVNRTKRHGDVEFVAVDDEYRRRGVASALCQRVFDAMGQDEVEVVAIATGGDPFHAPARAFCERLGMTPVPVVVYFKDL